jgi:hypothetical protein
MCIQLLSDAMCVTSQVAQLTGLSSSLTSLALRPHPQEVTLDSMYQLASMTQLQDLSLCPLPEACSASGLQQLLDMPQLTRLQLGTNDAAQVSLRQQSSSRDSSCSGQITGKQHQTAVVHVLLNPCPLHAFDW